MIVLNKKRSSLEVIPVSCDHDVCLKKRIIIEKKMQVF